MDGLSWWEKELVEGLFNLENSLGIHSVGETISAAEPSNILLNLVWLSAVYLQKKKQLGLCDVNASMLFRRQVHFHILS